jgi:hypothetical protein
MGEYSTRVRAEIANDNRTPKFIYVSFAIITLFTIFIFRGFAALLVVLGLGPVLVLIGIIEIYCQIQNRRRLCAAEDADADLDKLRPNSSAEAVVQKLRRRVQQTENAGEPFLAADLQLAIKTLERLDREATSSGRPARAALAPEPIPPA